MIVLRRFMRDRRRSVIGWTVGTFLFFLLQNAFYPSFKDEPAFSTAFDDLPDSVQSLFGFSDAVPLTSAPGWVQGQVFSLLPVLIVIFAVSLGVRALATSEEDGTLELLLSNPIERRRVAAERFGAFVALTFAVGLGSCLLTLATLPFLDLTDGVSMPGYFASALGVIGLGVLFGGLAFAIGAATGRRALALSIASGAAAVTYVFNGLAGSVEAAHPLRLVSPFHWFLGRNMLAQGVAVESLTLPFGLALVFVLLGGLFFLRRDLQTS